MAFVEFTLMFLDEHGRVAQHMAAQDIVRPKSDAERVIEGLTQRLATSPAGFQTRLRTEGYPDVEIDWKPRGLSAAIATVRASEDYADSLWLISRRNRLEDVACLEAFKQAAADRYDAEGVDETIGDVRATSLPVAVVSHATIDMPTRVDVMIHRADAYLAAAFFGYVRGLAG